MLKIDTYIIIGKDDMPDELRENKSFTILIDENMFKMTYFGEEFFGKNMFKEKIKKDISKRVNEVLENSEYIRDLMRENKNETNDDTI